jgi:hypothetical protein
MWSHGDIFNVVQQRGDRQMLTVCRAINLNCREISDPCDKNYALDAGDIGLYSCASWPRTCQVHLHLSGFG